MEIVIQPTYEDMSRLAAQQIATLVRNKPSCVLGLATGSTPIGVYQELIRMHRDEGLDFSKVTTFNLDEYYGLAATHPQSYSYFMNEELFSHINIPAEQIHVPSGVATDIDAFCSWYEGEILKAGGIDLQLVGIGRDGHIAFNEPGSSLQSRTRMKTLTRETVEDNARFFSDVSEVPRYAITMGVGTIMDAREIVMVANGKNKASVIVEALEGPVTSQVTASVLQMHPHVVCYLEKQAASKLTNREYYQWVFENKPGTEVPAPAPKTTRKKKNRR